MKVEIDTEILILILLFAWFFSYGIFSDLHGFWIVLIIEILGLIWLYGTFLLNGGIIIK